MTCYEYLRRVRRGEFVLLAAVIVLFILGLRVIPTVLLLAGLVCVWRLYRCPVCGHALDSRSSPEERTFCPHCGCDLLQEKQTRK